MTKLRPFSRKVRQKVHNCLNPMLVIGRKEENGFEATLVPKTNILCVGKWRFSLFCKVLSNEVEIVSWENKVERSKLFKSNVSKASVLENSFQTALKSTTYVLSVRKCLFFFFLFFWQIFKWRNCKMFQNASIQI